jgi:transposase
VLPLLLPDPGLRLDRVEITDPTITLCLRTTAPTASCPLCAQPAQKVHSLFARAAHDLPLLGRPTLLRLTARRFFCPTADCPRRVFCERLPLLLAKNAQSTGRLIDTQRDIGLALGGQPGARLAAKLSMPTSPDTLLRRVKQMPPPMAAEPARRVIGVDDWAIRKGNNYGTIIIDLERCEVVELLPGRDGVQLKTWLSQHPEVDVLSRDRASAFADAANEAAPQAQQVADRFHLFMNIRAALQRFLERYATRIAEVFAELAPAVTGPASLSDPPAVPGVVVPTAGDSGTEVVSEPPLATASAAPQRAPSAKQQRRLERYHEVRRRHAEGQSLRRIAREMRLSWNVVLRYVRSDHCPDWRPGRQGPSQAQPYRERIDAWLAEGNRNVSVLHRELQAEDATLRYDTLRRFVNRRLAARGEQRERLNAAQPQPPPPPSAKGLSFAVIARPTTRTENQQSQVARLRALDPVVAEAVSLVEGFAALLRKQGGTTLKEWQEKAGGSASIELRRFAEGLQRDQSAVQAAVDLAWSNGPVEGAINRLKTIKRQMYGRAGLPLLRARVLYAD